MPGDMSRCRVKRPSSWLHQVLYSEREEWLRLLIQASECIKIPRNVPETSREITTAQGKAGVAQAPNPREWVSQMPGNVTWAWSKESATAPRSLHRKQRVVQAPNAGEWVHQIPENMP